MSSAQWRLWVAILVLGIFVLLGFLFKRPGPSGASVLVIIVLVIYALVRRPR